MSQAKQTTKDTAQAFKEDGAIGKQFTPEGAIGGTFEAIGGPFASDGAIGKQFTTDGAIGGTVQQAAENTEQSMNEGMQNDVRKEEAKSQ